MGKAFSKMTPRIARVFILVALKKFFRDHPEYTYSDDASKTAITIQSDIAEDARFQNVNPAIIVEGGNITYQQLGVTNNMIDFNIHHEYLLETYHQFLASSSINIHCIASASDAAEELGFEVAMFMQSTRTQIGKMLQLQNISMPSQSKAQLITRQEWSGKYNSVVSFGYDFAIKRKHTPFDEGELLNEVNIIINPPVDPENPDGPGADYPADDDNGNGQHDPGEQTEPGDGVDDGWVKIRLKVTKDSVTGEQN